MSQIPSPASSFGRIDLPIRDVLRFIIPGGYGAISAAVIDHVLFHGKAGLADASLVVPVGFAFGLISFVGEFHKRFPPWKKRWFREMEAIAVEINAITGHQLARREEFAKPVYKLWIEAVCSADLRGYLHYETGLYYSTAAVSVLSVAGAIVVSGWLGFRLLSEFMISGARAFSSFSATLWSFDLSSDEFKGSLCVVGFLVMARLSYRMSRSLIIDVASHGRIAMELDTSRDDLVRLAGAATRTAANSDDKHAVTAIVKGVILEISPADLKLFESAQCDEIISQLNVRDGTTHRVAHVTITCNDPLELNGGANLYGGEKQRLLEGTLAMRLSARLNVDAVRLQIAPINDFWAKGFCSVEKQIRLLDLEEALGMNVITSGSPVEKCCREYGIDRIFVRGRYVVGPSPGLAAVLVEELARIKGNPRIFDPFAGTGLVERVCKSLRSGAVVFSQDRIGPDGKALNVDSFTAVPPSGDHDLIVVDPLYEDCLPYLELVGPKLRTARWIVQSGRECDLGWNARVEATLKKYGTVERCGTDTFGSRIYIVSHL